MSKDSGVLPRVVIAGGGVGALEAVLALRAQAGDGVEIVMLCPEERFEYRPLSVLEPFDVSTGWSVDLAEFAADTGVELRSELLAAVDPAAHRLRTADGEEIAYDALLIAIGCYATESLPGALAYGGRADALALRSMLDHLDYGQAQHLAFVAPDPTAWLVPLYELALLARARLDARGCKDAEVSVITAEQDPLEMLGERSADIAAMLLARNGITLRAGVQPVGVEPRAVLLADGGRIAADHIVTMPRMEAVPIVGIPRDAGGFIPIDDHGRVPGVADVYAAGDVTSGLPKQGGLAARVADAAANAILESFGRPVAAPAFAPVIEGIMLTGEVLRSFEPGEDGRPKATWQPPSKIAARHLAAYLQTRDPASHFPAEWQRSGRLPGELEVGGGLLDPTERDVQAMQRMPTFAAPALVADSETIKAARRELGDLAADDDETHRLRETLRAYLAAGCSVETAAHDLRCRPGDVRDAIARGEELLHHGIMERLLELRGALEILAGDTVGTRN